MLGNLASSIKEQAGIVKQNAAEYWAQNISGTAADAGFLAPPVKAANDVTSLYGLHSILRYDQYDEANGLFYNDNSVSFALEVIAQTGADDDMTVRLNSLFTPMPPKTGVQWMLYGCPNLETPLERYVDLRDIAFDKGLATEFFTHLARRRVKFIKDKKGHPLWNSENFMVKNVRLLISVTRTGQHSDSKLVEEMAELRESVRSILKTASLPAFHVDAEALINFLWPVLNPDSMFDKEDVGHIEYDPGKSIKDQLTLFGSRVKVTPTELIFGQPLEKKVKNDERIAMRAFGVLRYPKRKELWEMSNIIGSFFDGNLQYPCPFVIVGGTYTLDSNIVEGKVQLKAARAKSNEESPMARLQPELTLQAQDWAAVQYQVNEGGSLCEIYHTLLVFAPKYKLGRVSEISKNIWKSERFTIAPLNMLHLQALYASLPMTLTEGLRNDLAKMRLISTKTTVNSVDMSPVIGEWSGAGEPVVMLFGRRGTPTFLDIFSNQEGNYNVFTAGVSGSGKSVLLNEVVTAYRGTGAQAFIIDVGRSYQNLIKLQRGQFIEFTPNSKICMNPFSWVGQDEDNSFQEEMQLLKPMIGRMASPNSPIDDFQYSLIEAAITGVWKEYGPDSDPTKIALYLQDKVKNENGKPERKAYELSKMLLPYTKDGIYGSIFNGKANLSMDGDMVGLELEELKSAPDLRRVVLFVLTSRIAAQMYLERARRKVCLIDEAWQLLGDDAETAKFIEEGYRRARKYNGSFIVGTQGIEDAFKNDAARASYVNADWKILLRQDTKALNKAIDEGLINFSPAVKKQLLSLRKEDGRYSELMIMSPRGDHVLRHIPDPFSLAMAGTNARDFTETEALVSQGYSLEQALETILRNRGHLV